MHSHTSNKKLGNTLVDYSSGKDGAFGLDKHLITTVDTFHPNLDEHAVQSKSQPSSSKKKKVNSRFKHEGTSAKDSIKRLQYTNTEDEEKFEEDMRLTAHLNAMNMNYKASATNHPSISKYTNNPYKATSTLSFYNHMNDGKGIGKPSCDPSDLAGTGEVVKHKSSGNPSEGHLKKHINKSNRLAKSFISGESQTHKSSKCGCPRVRFIQPPAQFLEEAKKFTDGV